MKLAVTVRCVNGTHAKFHAWREVTLGNIEGNDYFQTRMISPSGEEFPLFFCHGGRDGKISINGQLIKREVEYRKLAVSVKRMGWSECFIVCCYNGIEAAVEVDGIKFIPLFPTTESLTCETCHTANGEESLCWRWTYNESIDSEEFDHLNDREFFRTLRID